MSVCFSLFSLFWFVRANVAEKKRDHHGRGCKQLTMGHVPWWPPSTHPYIAIKKARQESISLITAFGKKISLLSKKEPFSSPNYSGNNNNNNNNSNNNNNNDNKDKDRRYMQATTNDTLKKRQQKTPKRMKWIDPPCHQATMLPSSSQLSMPSNQRRRCARSSYPLELAGRARKEATSNKG